jgi:Porin PorA
MRRVVGGVLLALGSFILVAAVLLPTYGASGLVKIPLDQFTETVAEAEGATVFSPAELKERDGVNLVATRRVKSDVKAGSSDTVVFDVFLRVEDPDLQVDDPKERVISASTDRVALDRRTSEAVSCCDENVNGEPTEHKGLTYKFPFDTEKKTYQYFDNTALKSYPIRFVKTEEIEGVDAYKFQMTVEPVQIAELEVPGNLVGSTEKSVKAPRFYTNIRTIWVEPTSGVIIKGQEEQMHTLRDANGDDKVTLVNATLTWNDETVEKQSELAAENRDRISLLTTTLPIVLGVLGVLLLLVGLFLLISGRRNGTVGRRRASRHSEPVSV